MRDDFRLTPDCWMRPDLDHATRLAARAREGCGLMRIKDASSPDDHRRDAQALDMVLDRNGRRMQTGNIATMIFPVVQCISHVSRFIALHPGDLPITGPPRAAGEGQEPDGIFPPAGETMHRRIAGLGEQRQWMVAFDPTARA